MRTAIFPKTAMPYMNSMVIQPIQSKDLLFVSGQVGSLEDGSPVPDFEKQVIQAFKNLAETLKAAGCTFDDIIDVTTFHTDPERQFESIMKVKNQIFTQKPYPNWTAVGVTVSRL